MNIETRFDLGQMVVQVARRQHNGFDECTACAGRGRLPIERLDGTTQESYCEACQGRGRVREVWYDLYEVRSESRIGQIEIRLRVAPLGEGEPTREERYMIEATGIGSGTVHPLVGEGAKQTWTHSRLFATRAEAEAFCAAENGPLLAEVEEKRARLRDEVAA